MSDSVLDAAEAAEPAVAAIAGAIADESVPLVAAPTLDQRAAVLTAVQEARELPPGVRERLRGLVQQAVTLDVTGEPLLATRQVLELLAQGLPPALRRETPSAMQRPSHPAGDAFFALQGEDLTDQQADQIARQQLQRAGLLRTT
jgi:hypothetical protein